MSVENTPPPSEEPSPAGPSSADESPPTTAGAAPAEEAGRDRRRRRVLLLAGLLLLVAVVTFGVTGLLVSIFEHRQAAREPFVRLVEVSEVTSDPDPWGVNWPRQFNAYLRTADTRVPYGGSSAMPESKLEESPWLRRLYAGYAFSIDYREARGHAYMLYDQEVTERIVQRPQVGACLHCHASVVPLYRRLGLVDMTGAEPSVEELARDFNWPAVMRGFEISATMRYADAHRELLLTPDGTERGSTPLRPGQSSVDTQTPAHLHQLAPEDVAAHLGEAHPVSCVDCHNPDTLALRITRPGFILGIQALAESDDPVPHLPSVERWRQGSRREPYDPNAHASRQEMRSFVCGQCHVEYYCADKETLFFPWHYGLKVEQMEAYYDQHTFPDGSEFADYYHGETGAKMYKAQHPEFELWSQGVHARSGVSCSDCHMPYEREGAMKISSHWVRSPLLNINNACQTCHNVPEAQLLEQVQTIQNRNRQLLERAGEAMTEMLDAIREAQAAGATPEQLAQVFEYQRKAMWRLDFISSENSMGFHAPQEAARVLAESMDYSRRAQALALRYRAPEAPPTEHLPVRPIEGVTPTELAPDQENQ